MPDGVAPRRAGALVLAVLTAVAAGAIAWSVMQLRASANEAAAAGNAVVRRTVDGDTIVVAIGGREERVRLIGIDTPETKAPAAPVECFGPEAAARTASLLPEGTAVWLERDVEPRDVYGRLLAYVTRTSDGLVINDELVRGGFARPLVIRPNVAHRDHVAALADEARRTGQGLWGTCAGGPASGFVGLVPSGPRLAGAAG